ncbi:hypothetical protein OS42_10430 [Dickeya oryzae]
MITILTAAMFHLGAATFLAAYFIGNLKISKKNILLFVVLSMLIGIVSPLGDFLKQLPEISFLSRIQYYSGSKYDGDAGVLNNFVILKEVFFVSFFCLFILMF